MVRAYEVEAGVPLACSPTACRAPARLMPMPTSISEHPASGTRAESGAPAARPQTAQALSRTHHREAFALGFDVARVTTPDAIEPAGDRLMTFLDQGRHGDMTWMETTAERRRDPRVLWPEVQLRRHARAQATPLTRSPRRPRRAEQRRHLGLRQGPRLPRHHQGQAEGARRHLWRATAPCDVSVFVDTAPLMEKPLAHAAGIGWQGKHTNLVSRERRLVAVPRRRPHRARDSSRMLRKSITAEAAAAASTSARRMRSRALRARRAPLHRLPHDRAQRPYRARVPQADREPHLRLRRLPRRLPVEQVRRAQPSEVSFAATDATAKPAAGRAASARRRRVPQALCRHADQAHRARPLRAQCPDRGGKFGGCIVNPARHAALERCLGSRSSHGGLGVEPARPTRAVSAAKDGPIRRETDEAVRNEWLAEQSS